MRNIRREKFFGFILSIALTLSGAMSLAEPVSVTDVRNYMLDGDHAGLEVALTAQLVAVRDGDVTYDEQRASYRAFKTTDPRMHRFIRDWLENRPNSIHANTAQALSDYSLSFLIRGQDIIGRTYPEAIRTFRQMQMTGMAHAQRANSLDPGFVPASDAVIAFSQTIGSDRSVGAYLKAIMELSPNFGSVTRALSATAPAWGGNWLQAVRICALYADQITDAGGFTEDICRLQAALAANHGKERVSQAAAAVDYQHSHLIRHYAVKLALYYLQEDDTADQFARSQIENTKFRNLSMAEDYDTFIAKPRGWPSRSLLVYERALKNAQSEIHFDPYNPDLLSILARQHAGSSLVPDRPDREQRLDYAKRALVFQPYRSEAWMELYHSSQENWSEHEPLAGADALENAIAVSNHKSGVSANVMHWFNLIAARQTLENPIRGIPDEQLEKLRDSKFGKLAKADLLCPFVRAYRVWQNLCFAAPKNHACETGEHQTEAYALVAADAGNAGICTAERDAPIEDLFYRPVHVDLGLVSN